MSVQATANVLTEGPRMEDVDRRGKPYKTRARGFRAVLFTIADAANRDGENAHPGIRAMVEGSLYSKASVLAIVNELVAEGWLEITEVGQGRGHATVYRVVMDRRTRMVQSPDLSDASNDPVRGPERSSAFPEKVQSDGSTPITQPKTPTKPQRGVDSVDEKSRPAYGFEKFWEAWPKRNGKKLQRGSALTHWQRLNLDDKRAAYRGAVHYAAASTAGMAGAMDAFRWLKGRLWEDWQEPAVADQPHRGRDRDGDALRDAHERARQRDVLRGGSR